MHSLPSGAVGSTNPRETLAKPKVQTLDPAQMHSLPSGAVDPKDEPASKHKLPEDQHPDQHIHPNPLAAQHDVIVIVQNVPNLTARQLAALHPKKEKSVKVKV